MNNVRYRELLLRYMKDQCSPSELEELFGYIADRDGDALLRDLADHEIDTIDLSQRSLSDHRSDVLRQALASRISARRAGGTVWFTPRLFKVAAAVAVVAVCSWLVYRLVPAVANRHITYVTAYGEIREVTLPDQSLVVLNSNSRLQYDKDWPADGARKVWLEGEAFFKVTHLKNNNRFLVQTRNHVAVEVLGTEFNVNDRRLHTRVVLHSGSVRLDINNRQQQDSTVMMQSGELVDVDNQTGYSDDSRQITKKRVNTDIYIAWKNDKLVFLDTELAEIMAMIEDNYGYRVDVVDADVLHERFNGTFSSRDVDILLKTLARVYPITVEGKKIVVGT